MAFIAPAIGAASSLLGGILGNNAQKRAAEIQERFGKILAGSTAKTGENVVNRLTDLFNTSKTAYQPYSDLGQTATASLKDFLGLSGDTGPNSGKLVSDIPLNLPGATNIQAFKFDPAQAAVDPSLAFRLGEGQKAIERSAAAKGNLYAGGTGKALEQYAQGLGSEEYQAMFNRALQEYGTGREAQLTNWQTGVQNALNQFNATNTNRQNIYNRLSPSVAMGLNTANDLAGLNMGYGQSAGNVDIGTNDRLNEIWSAIANIQSGSQMASGNAWKNAISGVGNSIGGGLQLAQLKNLLGMQASGAGGGIGSSPVAGQFIWPGSEPSVQGPFTL